jgi:hypothetical protein
VTDWATVSELATATGTLVLAVATFASVRSANRAARAAENALLEGLRPVLVGSKLEDPPEKIRFMDDRWIHVPGGSAVAEVADEAIYLGMSLRNVGRGMAVLHAWDLVAELTGGRVDHRPVDTFRRLTRDLYIAPGDNGFWQGALRDPGEPLFAQIAETVRSRTGFTIDLMYGDVEGSQRVVSRFAITPRETEEGDVRWLLTVARHWNLDRADPR